MGALTYLLRSPIEAIGKRIEGTSRNMGWFKQWRTRNHLKADRAASQPRSRFNLFGGRRYLKNESYFLPKDDTEISRLDFQHYLFRFYLRGNYAAPIGQPTSILDVGCGTSRWGMEVVREFPNANVFGLDLLPAPVDDGAASQSPNNPRPANYVYIQGNALDGLPFADGTFDFVHQRLLVAGIPLAR